MTDSTPADRPADRPAATLHAGEHVIPKLQVDATGLAAFADVAQFSPRAQERALRDLQKRIGEGNAAKGFHEEGERLRTFVTQPEAGNDDLHEADVANLRNYETARLALIVTEAAEAIEELRSGRASNETWYSAKVNGGTYAWNAGERPDALDDDVLGKPKGVPSEIADVVIRSFDFAHEAGFDLAEIIAEKLAYNATRAHKHGRKF